LADKDENINLNMNFLGLNLSSVPSQDFKKDPKVCIIPVLYVITSLISMKLTTSLNANKKQKEQKKDIKTNLPDKVDKNSEDTAEMMEQMNKSMTWFMPVMTVSIAVIAPLGLALYWFLSNLLSIFERLIVYKVFKTEEEE